MNKSDEIEIELLEKEINEKENIKNKFKLDDNIKKIITIVEDFLKKKQLICYGGTAINNILPKNDQAMIKLKYLIMIFILLMR